MGPNVNKQRQICGPDIFNKYIILIYIYMHEQLYLAISHIYGCRFPCLNMVKMLDVNNSDLKDTSIASLSIGAQFSYYAVKHSTVNPRVKCSSHTKKANYTNANSLIVSFHCYCIITYSASWVKYMLCFYKIGVVKR